MRSGKTPASFVNAGVAGIGQDLGWRRHGLDQDLGWRRHGQGQDLGMEGAWSGQDMDRGGVSTWTWGGGAWP